MFVYLDEYELFAQPRAAGHYIVFCMSYSFTQIGFLATFRFQEKPVNNDYSFRTLWQFLKAVHLKRGKYLTWL